MLGRICRVTMRRSLAPRARAALRYSRSRTAMTCANQAGEPGPASNGVGQHQISKPRPEKCGDGDGEQNAVQDKRSIHGNGGESGVDPSAGVVGNT